MYMYVRAHMYVHVYMHTHIQYASVNVCVCVWHDSFTGMCDMTSKYQSKGKVSLCIILCIIHM